MPPDVNVPLVEATAGATGALMVSVMLMPVEIAKTRQQTGMSSEGLIGTIQKVFETSGWPGLFKGLQMKSVEVVLRNFLYFYAYEWLKARYYRLGFKPSTLGHTACGVAAGMSNLTVTMPIDTLNVRIQSDSRSRSTSEVMRELVAEGAGSMWSGFAISSILTLNPALTFAVFDKLKARVLKVLGSTKLSAAQAFVLGSVSKVFATLICYPLMRAKSIQQVEGKRIQQAAAQNGQPKGSCTNGTATAHNGAAAAPTEPRGFVQVLHDIFAQEGVAGLYRGVSAQIFSAVTKSGILLTSKEQLAAFAMALVLMLQKRPPKLAS